MDYWKECISEAAEECGLSLSDEQLKCLSDWVENAHENYSMAFGYDCISSPAESRAQQELRELKQKNATYENWINSTKPCKRCATTGNVIDGWGRDVGCGDCDGKGRI